MAAVAVVGEVVDVEVAEGVVVSVLWTLFLSYGF